MDPAVLPLPFQTELSRYWHRLSSESRAEYTIKDPELIQTVNRVWACSAFIANYCTQDPARLRALLETGDLARHYSADEYAQRVRAAFAEVTDEASMMRVLRQLRNREMVRIAWRDIAGHADLEETLVDLSRLADAVLDLTLAWLYRQLSRVFGKPEDAAGEPQSMIILALGKLGAHELNFSSDIDLIFAYPKDGETRGGTRSLSNHEFFNRLGQKLIKVLGEVTRDGLVFRVDMRLRPFGESGPLVMSFAGMEAYYQAHGRDWERYALIKARVIAGDQAAGKRLMAMLKPFVYRRYLDFGAIDALREMKRMINEEIRRKGMASNIKLGPGGIREIEFIGQIFQLMRGGRNAALQTRPILRVLGHLKAFNYLPEQAISELVTAYTFLRKTEHRLQQIQDRQAHSLPENDLDRQRIALGMGFCDWEEFLVALGAHRQCVQHHFTLLLEPRENGWAERSQSPAYADLSGVWLSLGEPEAMIQLLRTYGFGDPATILEALQKLHATAESRNISPTARERLDRLVPRLLMAVRRSSNPATTLTRLTPLLETIAQRSVYLALLAEYPAALEHLIKLCSASPWIAAYIARQPILLDELLDPRTLYSPPGPAELETQLTEQLSYLSEADLEQEMNALRHFKHSQVLRVAAADLTGVLWVGTVSDQLSAIAETVLKAALRLAWDDLIGRHGEARCVDAGVDRPAGFAIVAYGKLGGLELGYGSDLDLVFLHDSRGEKQLTTGPKSLDNQEFFARLGQRIIHLITTITPAGKAYDIDARLRPSGSSGLLVSSLNAFAEYQQHHAWTWEHQALVRARPVAGSPATREEFSTIRAAVLGRERDEASLKQDVRDMCERMRRELGNREPDRFDLKGGQGGITDIEFMVQYIVLRWAAAHPLLLSSTANCPLLEIGAACKLLDPHDAEALCEAYFAYRARIHALALQEQPARVSEGEFRTHRSKVVDIWRRLLEA
jgi:[glutamine synthetase] adenylyltransferase / [glutamine synthetase]-adenylyl-L-tyrosine phosphorylase